MPGTSRRPAMLVTGAIALVVLAVVVFANQAADRQPPPPPIVIPTGTAMTVKLETSLSTENAHVGDRFTGVVSAPVVIDGLTAIPAGAAVSGHVILSDQPGKTSGRGRMQLAYDRLSFGGEAYDLATKGVIYVSESGKSKDAAMIGGGAIAGGIAGGILGGSAGDAAKGVIIGGAAGTAVSLLTRGPDLELNRGIVLTVRLDTPLTVPRPV